MSTGAGMPPLVLASSSPRRKELLSAFGRPFQVEVPAVEEFLLPGEAPAAHVRRLAAEKAEAVACRFRRALVVGADTVVVFDGRVIGKPRDRRDAERILSSLSGRSHFVYTGVAVTQFSGGKRRTVVVRSRVVFKLLSPSWIRKYVDSGETLDKAGSYALQGRGDEFIEEVQGPPSNVIGLPLRALGVLLRHFGADVATPPEVSWRAALPRERGSIQVDESIDKKRVKG